MLALAESARIVAVTADIAVNGGPTAPPASRDLLWYAELSTPRLWARRVFGNMTFRSVLFQNAVRIALSLAAARLVAGSLDLAHGFWVLLTVLTLERTTVGATWQTVRRSVAGNAVGLSWRGPPDGVGQHTDVYAVLLAPAILVGFSLGPLLGIAYTRGAFTLVVSTVFAQMSPVTWRLSEARMIDVVTGSVIGLLCGLLAWPAGAQKEVRRAMTGLLHSCGAMVPTTAETLLAPSPGSPAQPQTWPSRHRLRLAEAAYVQYRGETRNPRRKPAPTGKQCSSFPTACSRARTGCPLRPASELRYDGPVRGLGPRHSGRPGSGGRPDRFTAGRQTVPARPPVQQPGDYPPTSLSVDLEVWMTSLRHQFARIEASMTPPSRSGPLECPGAATGNPENTTHGAMASRAPVEAMPGHGDTCLEPRFPLHAGHREGRHSPAAGPGAPGPRNAVRP
ncbi:FUSC family protein [Streptomyces sp. M10(2022)]